MKKKFLAVFDLDGTLFDTDEVNFCAYRDSLENYGIQLDRDYFVTECMGRHYTEFLPKLVTQKEQIESIHKDKKNNYIKNLSKARINQHLFRLIKCIKDEYYIAIVTTASKKNTYDILDYFECAKLFDLILTQEDVTKKKPDPEGFLMAMNYFEIDAGHTLIYEDSESGIEAARAAGAAVMIVDSFS